MTEPNSYYMGIINSNLKKNRHDGKKAQERMIKSTAYSHGILVYTLYMPKIFNENMVSYFKYISDTMYGILDKVIKEYEINPEYRRLFGFDARLEELILRPRTYSCSLPISRIDIFFNEDDYSFKFCEFNADGASAMNEDRELNKIISQTYAYKKFAEKFNIRTSELFESWADEFLKIYSETENACPCPHIAIVDFIHGEKNYEFEAFREAFNSRNCTCEICDIEELQYSGSALYSKSGKKIDAIYRRAVTCDIMHEYNNITDFINAVKDNSVILIGDFRTQIIHNKIIFAILHHKMTAKFLTEEECEFINEHIPFTARLCSESIEKYKILEEKDKWVVKPEDSYASKGVLAGVECKHNKKWRKFVKENMDNNYILQEYCKPYENINIDLLHNSEAQYMPYSNITGLFVYGGKLSGIYSRIAKNSIISTQYSEMSLPTIIVDEK